MMIVDLQCRALGRPVPSLPCRSDTKPTPQGAYFFCPFFFLAVALCTSYSLWYLTATLYGLLP